MAIAITGDITRQQREYVADQIEKDLLNLPGISDIVVSGTSRTGDRNQCK